MRIDKAVEILEVIVLEQAEYIGHDGPDAVKLGIEALKRWKEDRGTGSLMDPLLLPGETKE